MRRLCALLLVAAGCAIAQPIDYARQIHPIFVTRCLSCHQGAKAQAGLSLATRESMVAKAVIPGDADNSLLMKRITGAQLPLMPVGGDKLRDSEIALLRRWINEGATVNISPSAAAPEFSLALKPPTAASIDAILAPYYRKNGVAPVKPVSDAVFARRAYLDVWGLLPTPEQQQRFAADTRPDKRARLVDELLANSRHYSEHWITFWNDLLHNDEGVTFHGERQSITPWLLKALEDNQHYDAFVSSLLNPGKENEGFLKGVTWRGTVNASQTPTMQAAQNSAQVFLGVNLKCNSCHDSFISHWKLREAYALASFFSTETLEIVKCDKPTGATAQPRFLFPELGSIDATASLADRRAAAARMFTARENGLFPRTIVNRVWKQLIGRGLVEPADEMELPAWSPELLDWLAQDFVDSGYDLKHLLRRIILSEPYQRPSVKSGALRDAKYIFSGPWPRRLTAEQFSDAISSLTGEWRIRSDNRPIPGTYAREWRFKANYLTRALGRPQRDGAVTERLTESTTLQAIELTNGATLNRMLRNGSKRLVDLPDPAPASLWDSGLFRAKDRPKATVDLTGRKHLRLLVADVDSYDPSRVVVDWTDAEFVTANGSVEKAAVAPVVLGKEQTFDIAGKSYTQFRATLVVDPKSNDSEIGPAIRAYAFDEAPNFEKLVTVKGEPPIPRLTPARTPDALIRQIYRYALGRAPNETEMRIALGLAAKQGRVDPQGLEDVLWSLVLSPEFQFIR